MHFQIVSGNDFLKSPRWTASFFLEEEELPSAFPKVAVKSLVTERRASVDPRSLGDEIIHYVGLENIRSGTGELTGFSPRPASDIKSRSKLFQVDDILFGRLRPELNKVLLVNDKLGSGLCSNEVIVLTPRCELIKPRLLRHLLASAFVMSKCAKLTVGAALPRISSADLLEIEIPLPPLPVQERLTEHLAELDRKLEVARRTVDLLPSAIAEDLVRALAEGADEVSAEFS